MHGKKTQKIGFTRTCSRLNSIKEHLLSPKNNKRILQNLKKSLMTQEDICKDQKIDFIGQKKSTNKKIIYSKINRSQFDSFRTKNFDTSQINTTQFNSNLQSPKISFNAYNSSALNSPNATLNFSEPKFRKTPNILPKTPKPQTNPHPQYNNPAQNNPNRNLKNLLSKKIQNQYNIETKIFPEPKKELSKNNFLTKIKKIYSKEFCPENFGPRIQCSVREKCQPDGGQRVSRLLTRNFGGDPGQARYQDPPKKILDIENFNSIIVDQRNNFAKEQQNFDGDRVFRRASRVGGFLDMDLGVEIFDQDCFDSGSCSNGEFSITEMSEIQKGHFWQGRERVKGRARSEVSPCRMVKGKALSLRDDEMDRGEFFKKFDQMLTG
jgi:hypothetical protein